MVRIGTHVLASQSPHHTLKLPFGSTKYKILEANFGRDLRAVVSGIGISLGGNGGGRQRIVIGLFAPVRHLLRQEF